MWRLECVMAVEQAFMCGKSCRVDTVVVSSLIMLPGELMDRHGGCKASGEAGFKKEIDTIAKSFPSLTICCVPRCPLFVCRASLNVTSLKRKKS